MLSKKEIKDIQSLSLKKSREETGCFVAEGPKIVEELLLLVPEQVIAVYALASWQSKTQTGKWVEITEPELQKITQLATPNQVVAILKQFQSREPGNMGFTLYLDTIQDPGNLGTMIRIADWFGVKNIVCSAGCVDVYNPKVVQSTMASIARINVFYDTHDNWLLKQKAPVYASSLHGKELSSFPKTERGILVIGNESKGIRREFLKRANELITIPKRGEAESLNAAVATGILLSHLLP